MNALAMKEATESLFVALLSGCYWIVVKSLSILDIERILVSLALVSNEILEARGWKVVILLKWF